MVIRIATVVVALVVSVAWARAAQDLIPSPYPVTVPGALPLDPEPQRPGRPQRLMLDPYPQALGAFAQGNPPIARRHRHQRRVPSLYQRKYRVERHGR